MLLYYIIVFVGWMKLSQQVIRNVMNVAQYETAITYSNRSIYYLFHLLGIPIAWISIWLFMATNNTKIIYHQRRRFIPYSSSVLCFNDKSRLSTYNTFTFLKYQITLEEKSNHDILKNFHSFQKIFFPSRVSFNNFEQTCC